MTAGQVSALGDLSPLLAIPLLAVTYALGWAVNFLGERLFKWFGQERVRDELFRRANVGYSHARETVFQEASETAIEALRFDRHILRVSRSTAMQLPLIGFGIALNWPLNSTPVVVALALVAVLAGASFVQWRTRYSANKERLLRLYEIIVADRENPRAAPGRSSEGLEQGTERTGRSVTG